MSVDPTALLPSSVVYQWGSAQTMAWQRGGDNLNTTTTTTGGDGVSSYWTITTTVHDTQASTSSGSAMYPWFGSAPYQWDELDTFDATTVSHSFTIVGDHLTTSDSTIHQVTSAHFWGGSSGPTHYDATRTTTTTTHSVEVDQVAGRAGVDAYSLDRKSDDKTTIAGQGTFSGNPAIYSGTYSFAAKGSTTDTEHTPGDPSPDSHADTDITVGRAYDVSASSSAYQIDSSETIADAGTFMSGTVAAGSDGVAAGRWNNHNISLAASGTTMGSPPSTYTMTASGRQGFKYRATGSGYDPDHGLSVTWDWSVGEDSAYNVTDTDGSSTAVVVDRVDLGMAAQITDATATVPFNVFASDTQTLDTTAGLFQLGAGGLFLVGEELGGQQRFSMHRIPPTPAVPLRNPVVTPADTLYNWYAERWNKGEICWPFGGEAIPPRPPAALPPGYNPTLIDPWVQKTLPGTYLWVRPKFFYGRRWTGYQLWVYNDEFGDRRIAWGQYVDGLLIDEGDLPYNVGGPWK
jgi:hypothetical protein